MRLHYNSIIEQTNIYFEILSQNVKFNLTKLIRYCGHHVMKRLGYIW